MTSDGSNVIHMGKVNTRRDFGIASARETEKYIAKQSLYRDIAKLVVGSWLEAGIEQNEYECALYAPVTLSDFHKEKRPTGKKWINAVKHYLSEAIKAKFTGQSFMYEIDVTKVEDTVMFSLHILNVLGEDVDLGMQKGMLHRIISEAPSEQMKKYCRIIDQATSPKQYSRIRQQKKASAALG